MPSTRSPVRLLVVAMDDDAAAEYARLVRSLGADCFVAYTPEDIAAILRGAPLHGVVLDTPTAVRIKGPDKQWVFRHLELFPIIRLRYNHKNETITALGSDQDATASLKEFVERTCKAFTPRTIRRIERKTLRYNIILTRDGETHGEPAVLDNFTPLGCFVITTTPLSPGERVVVVFPGAGPRGDHLHVGARVIHHAPWGRERTLPGVGLSFETDNDQREALERLFRI
ncbi:MAG: hypothetical protein ACOCWR_05185 [Oceanidesulfovibrio sp.]